MARRGPAQQLAQRHFGTTDGLLQNTVYALLQDHTGRLWAGTRGGACWYDGTGFHPLAAQGRTPDSNVSALAEQADGTLWLGHFHGGLSWVRHGRLRHYRPAGFDANALVFALYFDDAQTLWVGSSAGLYRCHFGPADTAVVHVDQRQGLPNNQVSGLCPGPAGQLLVATGHGLALVAAATGRVLPAPVAPLASLPQEEFRQVVRAADTLWWAASFGGGVLRLSCARPGAPWRVRRYLSGPGSPNVLAVRPDARGRLWALSTAGTGCLDHTGHWQFYPDPANLSFRPGLLLEDAEKNLWIAHGSAGLDQRLADERFAYYAEAQGLPAGGVMTVAPAGPGAYWLGTHLGLRYFEPGAAAGRQVRDVPQPAELHTFVRSFAADRRRGLWVGTAGSVARYDSATARWQSFAHVPELQHKRVLGLAEDRQGRMWLATERGGLSVYTPATGRWRTYTAADPDGPGTASFWKLLRDRRGRLWFGTDDRGLLWLDEGGNGRPDRFRQVPGSAALATLTDVSEGRPGELWVTSPANGLLRYDGHRLRPVPTATYPGHWPALALLGVEADPTGRVWLGTGQGLDLYEPRTGRVQRFGPAEGFFGEGAQQLATHRTPDGTLWVGTNQGLMRYVPGGRWPNRRPPATRVTGLRLFLRDTVAAPGLTLAHGQNQLTFDYLGLCLTNPAAVRYRYQLVGFDAGWQGPVARRNATYTNLPPGAYTFRVLAANNEGVWSTRPATYAFTIRPPWWRTWWAYLLYGSLFGLTIYGVRAYTRSRERERADRELERQALRHLQEMDRVKSVFFTNVSHELRTPLTLILGPAETLATAPADPAIRREGSLVLRNARKLLALINQLLDLSKLEAGALRLLPTSGDVAAFTRQLVVSFSSLAESRAIELRCEVPATPVPLVFDASKLEEIITNLLANALRFTPAGGSVTVTVAETPPDRYAPDGGVAVAVRDTGPGIAAEDLPHLFDRFYQANNSGDEQRTGTGIGLALVRELVALHGGTVEVSNAPGAGATFTVQLPRLLQPATGAAQPGVSQPLAAQLAPPSSADAPNADAESQEKGLRELVLIVEDNDEVREFIRATLAPAGYRLLTAADGKAGVTLARAEVPDLIVSDVMMPGLSGYEVCQALKTDPATSHIPVVLLTARSGPDARLEGFETGADSFLAKPFSPRELRAQVRNLLALRQSVQARLAVPAPVAAESPAAGTDAAVAPAPAPPQPAADPLAAHEAAVAGLPSLDQEFLRRVNESVLRHLADEQFGVDQLGADIGMSRTQVHRKLKALTGQSPGERIRQTRLHRALALLRAQVGTVAEVSYQVGFGSPAAFSTAFSRQFGYPPSAAARHGREAEMERNG
ncbi:hybrid sensor histidine kinase/response regulator transcription factor [Hymenobacter ruricola]|uniref:histidine kinase n=1 Tax=Hymenobacter ruricola TaxID=2791023 RepID=A0ABS0I0I6_9BACT|nr:two-component regulator propeller domain-containing protein [Hymenobacter ruricola]MBF9220243.1 response regulator [Hymenobacter ruricola]